MQEQIYQTPIHDVVNDLKQLLLDVCIVWAALDQKIIDNAVAQRRKRLRACVQKEDTLNIFN